MNNLSDSTGRDAKSAPPTPAAENPPADSTPPPPKDTPPDPGPPPNVPAPNNSFEVALGSVWLVRIGIVMLLTGFVFLAKLAYTEIMAALGPAPKVGLLYVFSFGLLGAGAWLRKRHESLAAFSQVVFAGGLAAVYFTTYAAHFYEPLRIITSAYAAGILLLAWAGYMVWLADQRKSQIMGLFAIGLAFYTAAMTQVGWFTLYSNLILAAAVVYFVTRNRWIWVSLAGLVGTYAGWAYWRFPGLDGTISVPDYWFGLSFLATYWGLFLFTSLCSTDLKRDDTIRTTIFTLNNLAVVTLGGLATWWTLPTFLWFFPTAIGALILAVGCLNRPALDERPQLKKAFTIQGLLLVTWGMATWFSGPSLAIALAVEGTALLLISNRAERRFTTVCGVILSVGALGLALRDHGLLSSGFVGLIFLFNAWWLERPGKDAKDSPNSKFAAIGFSVAAFFLWAEAATRLDVSEYGSLLICAAIAVTIATRTLGMKLTSLFGHGLVAFATVVTLVQLAAGKAQPHPIGVPAACGAILALMFWWRWQGKGERFKTEVATLQTLALLGLLTLGVRPLVGDDLWVSLAPFVGITLTAVGLATRIHALAILSQLLLIDSVWVFLQGIMMGVVPPWSAAVMPLLVLAANTELLIHYLDSRRRKGESLAPWMEPAALGLGVATLALALLCVRTYLTSDVWFTMTAMLAVGYGVLALRSKDLIRVRLVAGFAIVAMLMFVHQYADSLHFHLLDVVWIVGLLAIVRRFRGVTDSQVLGGEFPKVMIHAYGFALWLWCSRGANLIVDGALLAVTWALLAAGLICAGIVIGEKHYRRMGFALLGVAIGRVFLIDVWALAPVFRVLCFMGFGVILIGLGYIYARNQERIRTLA